MRVFLGTRGGEALLVALLTRVLTGQETPTLALRLQVVLVGVVSAVVRARVVCARVGSAAAGERGAAVLVAAP